MRLAGLILLGLTLGAGAHARARGFSGEVSHVTDGDTLWVRRAGAAEALPVRIQGIDAPEICQAFGPQARSALTAFVLHRTVTVDSRARDGYHRLVARVTLNGQDLGAWMVGRGLAWSYHYRHGTGPYGALESQARLARIGMWAGAAPQEPRTFRKRHGSCKP